MRFIRLRINFSFIGFTGHWTCSREAYKGLLIYSFMVKFKIVHNEVIVDKKITKLDQFALDVIKIIQNYTDYIIISSYVSIFFGRSRATEDIDMFIKEIDYKTFEKLYTEFTNIGFEFNIENYHDIYYESLKKGTPINIWVKNFPLLRMEIKVAKKNSELLQLNNPLIIIFGDKKLKFAQIESQIAYKRYIAKSQKDLEDARHLEIVFEGLSLEKIKYYKSLFLSEFI